MSGTFCYEQISDHFHAPTGGHFKRGHPEPLIGHVRRHFENGEEFRRFLMA